MSHSLFTTNKTEKAREARYNERANDLSKKIWEQVGAGSSGVKEQEAFWGIYSNLMYSNLASKERLTALRCLHHRFNHTSPTAYLERAKHLIKVAEITEAIVGYNHLAHEDYKRNGQSNYSSKWSGEMRDEERFHRPSDLSFKAAQEELEPLENVIKH